MPPRVIQDEGSQTLDLQTVLDPTKMQSFTQDITNKFQETFGMEGNQDFIR